MSKKGGDTSSISSRSSRRKTDSKSSLDSSALKEARAAYVVVVREVKHDLTSKKQLASGLSLVIILGTIAELLFL